MALNQVPGGPPVQHPTRIRDGEGPNLRFHIEGELDVVFFDDSGRVARRVRMGPADSGRTVIYRLSNDQWHTVVVRTETAVVHETTNGPFDPQENEFAPWSPEPGERAAVARFMRQLTE